MSSNHALKAPQTPEARICTQRIRQYQAVLGSVRCQVAGNIFYTADVTSLKPEGSVSLKVVLDVCREDGIEPRKNYSGKSLNARLANATAQALGATLGKYRGRSWFSPFQLSAGGAMINSSFAGTAISRCVTKRLEQSSQSIFKKETT